MRRTRGRLFPGAILLLGCGTSDPVAASDVGSDAVLGDGTSDAADAADTSPADATDATCKLVKAYSSKNAVCNACAQGRCCAEVNGCLGDPRCDDDYVNCILACALLPADAGDAGAEAKACVARCGVDFPAGRAAYDAAIGCVDLRCKTECG